MSNKKRKKELIAYKDLLHSIDQSKFTMNEIMPVLKDFLTKKFGCYYMIQWRYILEPNPTQSILEEPNYHLSIEYHAHPTSMYLLLQNHIIWNGKPCNYIQMKNFKIQLIPMDSDELYEKEKNDELFHFLKSENKIIWLATEEKDLTVEQIGNGQNWLNPGIPCDKRKINDSLLSSTIKQYIYQKENKIVQPIEQLSSERIDELLEEFFEQEKVKHYDR